MRLRSFALGFVLLPVIACGARSRRDMDVPQREVTYNDSCSLQDYFDQRTAAALPPPPATDELLATNSKGQTIGEGSYVLRDPLARRRFARLLHDEYKGIDDKVVAAVEHQDGKVVVRVSWWDAGPIRRIRPDRDVRLHTRHGVVELPPNPCVSDFIFGEKLYGLRARLLRQEVGLATDHVTAPPSSVEPSSSVPPSPSASVPPSSPPAPSASPAPSTTTGS